jgi:enoyl-CoA hydratase
MPHDLLIADDPGAGVRRLTMNRPEQRNALSNRLRAELFDAMRNADADDDISVIVIRGAGPCFSAGYDLRQDPSEPLARHAAPADGFWSRHLIEGWFEMWDYATPVIAQVHGYCLAGGTELVAACDLAYVAHDAVIGYPPVRLMSPPDMTWQPWFMGARRAMEALLTGDALTGVEAVDAGFANRSFPEGELEAEVLRIAERVARIPKDLLALNKRVVHRAMDIMGIRAGIRATAEVQALGFHQQSSKEYRNQLAAGQLTEALSARDHQFGDYREARRRSQD